MTKLRILMESIAHVEGFYVTEADAKAQGRKFPTIPQRTNNPGDLMFAKQAKATPYPIVGTDGKTRVYAAFPTIEDGWAALQAQILLDVGRGLTLEKFIHKYAPASDGNDPKSYLSHVARDLGCAPGTLLKDAVT